MNADRAIAARRLGQSLWYDNISRALLKSGEIAELVKTGIITGITTNPTIFQKALEGSDAYDAAIAALVNAGKNSSDIYHGLTMGDVGEAADLLKPVHDQSEGVDGFVSLEVAPGFANDAEGTVAEALRLFKALARPNVMIKVPGTRSGVESFRRLTEAGVNVNVTLLFSVKQYEAIGKAYLEGLRARARKGEPVSRVASVASFFVSRVDNVVDAALERLAAEKGGSVAEQSRSILGRAGVANCKAAYVRFKELFSAPFKDLRDKGARPQRMLWASTGTKNPKYSDVMYVNPLIGKDTVNTLPPATLKAFLDHGSAEATVEREVSRAFADLALLQNLGIDLDRVCEKLQDDGVAAFAQSFDAMMGALEKKVSVRL